MKDPALLTGELRVPRTDSRALRLEAIEREIRSIRWEHSRMPWSVYLQAERDRLLKRRCELEEERGRLMEQGTGA